MNWTRGFTHREEIEQPVRNVEGAPDAMRQEIIDAFYLVANQTGGLLNINRDLYFTIIQNLGFEATGNPHAGRRQRIGRDILQVEWPRIYDLLERLWPEFQQHGFHEIYRENINRILAAHGIAWDLGEDGQFHRVLPLAAQAQINAAIAELSDPCYAAALELFNSARDDYDNRPRNDRDACSNAFDALESVAKIKYQMPDSTFGQVVTHIRQTHCLNDQITGTLDAINTLRNRNFGHGMNIPFNLNPAEVDFTYLTCIGGILLFTRTP